MGTGAAPTGRILQVDLSAGSCTVRRLPAGILAEAPGGRALGAWLLREAQSRPDDARGAMVFAPGALCGSGAPASDRLSIVFSSPLSGTIFDVSAGGAFALALAGAGYAALVVVGRSDTPVLLSIDAEGARVGDGRDYWGKDADAVALALAADGAGVLAIGPAGENRVRFAGLHGNDGNGFGRGGPGALLGAKRLKALVVRGCAPRGVAEPERFAAASADLLRLFRASPILCGEVGFGNFGEAALIDLAARRGLLPAENFRATFPADASAFNAAAVLRSGASRAFGCAGCPIACKRRDEGGRPLPDFAPLAAFGALLGLADLAAIRRANVLCNRLGLDPVSLAGTLAARAEISGRPLAVDELEALLPAIATRSGEGASLADGAWRYAEEHGRPEAALCVRRLELAPLDPRGLCGLALGCAVAAGGQGEHSLTLSAELLRKPVPVERLDWGGKGRLVRRGEEAVAAFDSLGLCRHALFAAGLEEAAALYAAVSGTPCSATDLAALGARTLALERSLPTAYPPVAPNAALPRRLFTPVDGRGHRAAPPPLDARRFEEEVQRYGRLREPHPTSPLPGEEAEPDGGALHVSLSRYAAKLVAEGVGRSGRIALIVRDDRPLALGPDDLVRRGIAILERTGLTALCLVEPLWPFADFLLRREPRAQAIVPRDIETRTFLHAIPIVRASEDPAAAAAALGGRKGVLLAGGLLCAGGTLTIEQAYVNVSSLWHALYVKYLLDVLVDGLRLEGEAQTFAAFRAAALGEPSAAGLDFASGPLSDAATIEEEMARVGRYTVERKLVDSFFGNISCRLGDELYISQTASSLDALAGCIDPVPFDNRTTLGLTASSELAAHRRVYELTEATTILHGHPRFAVALSMLCAERKDCPVADCWRDCPHVRLLGGVPVVAGEIGAGGLARRVPPVIGGPKRAIVYGHGVFAIGRDDFAEPFTALVETERWCRQEYFRRFDAGTIYG